MTSADCQKLHPSIVRSFRTARALGKIRLVPQLFFAMGPQIWPGIVTGPGMELLEQQIPTKNGWIRYQQQNWGLQYIKPKVTDCFGHLLRAMMKTLLDQ